MGAHVVSELIHQGNTEVVALDDLSGGFRGESRPCRNLC